MERTFSQLQIWSTHQIIFRDPILRIFAVGKAFLVPYLLPGRHSVFYIREDIPYTVLNSDMSIESIEINIRRKKWLLVCTYNPNKNLISNHLEEIGKNLDNFFWKYDNFILLGDLNSEPTESAIRDFCRIYSCKNLIKDITYFKNPFKASYTDLAITNRRKSFQDYVTEETALPDFYKMTLTGMKISM